MFKFEMFDKESPREVVPMPSVHEQEDGTILAMCVSGTSSKDSLASWIKFLERDNPQLATIPVVFRLRTPETGIQLYNPETGSPGAQVAITTDPDT